MIMQAILLTILFLLLWSVTQSVRLACYRKQTKHLLEQLNMACKEETNLLFTSAVSIGRTEEVISLWNQILSQYRQSKERLMRENRSYRESITSISHDIRTPLTSAKGYMQMLRMEQLPEQKRLEYVRIVEQRLDDLAKMLDQLFLYTRIEAGELPLIMEKVNASNLFAETLSMFYQDFLEKGCEPEVQITKQPCRMMADRQALVRIMENLIKNALIHGTGDYQMACYPENTDAVILVANRTDSIQAGDLESIFDRFYTTDLSRSRRTTGLGLAIVKELTHQMGGTASARLADGIFPVEIRLPLNLS